MFKSIRYVLNENFSNLYRIFCIAKYELLADMRDSKFGIFWNFASPAIQVFTYWLIFGCMLLIAFVTLAIHGFFPNIYWFGLLYYALCAFAFVEAVSLILSVLTMLWRDIRKLITSLMRMLMYFSPVIWECHFGNHVPYHELLNKIMKLNPVYYIVNGYRDSIFYNKTFLDHPAQTLYFWAVVIILFVIGCALMYKFKRKFIDMI